MAGEETKLKGSVYSVSVSDDVEVYIMLQLYTFHKAAITKDTEEDKALQVWHVRSQYEALVTYT